jgi:hypothetical protein
MATRIGPETKARIAAAWPDLITVVADGGNIGDACKARGLTRDQVRVYRLQNPEADKEWQLAIEQSADAFCDQAQSIANSPGADSRAARVSLQALMWLASRRNPRVYGEKQQLNVNVRSVDLTQIILAANKRLQSAQPGRLIEGELASVRLADLS